MPRILAILAALFALSAGPLFAADATIPQRAMGKADAPITVDEYVSLTCPHCAAFYNDILPQLEPKYVDTGKVRFVFHVFVRDGVDMKAASLAYCMPEDQFYPFVSTLFKNQAQWALAPNVDTVLVQYAKLGGLSEDKAKACLNDKAMQDALIADRTAVNEKLNVQSTPTFLINYGAEKLEGAKPVADFSAVFDRLLAAKK